MPYGFGFLIFPTMKSAGMVYTAAARVRMNEVAEA